MATPHWEIVATDGKTYKMELSASADPAVELERFVAGTSAWSGNEWLGLRDGEYLRADQIVVIRVPRSHRAAGF